MTFQQAVDYLYSLGNEVSAMKLGLENIRKLIAALGDPQNKYVKVQVAGTNGKGSVCAFLNSICVHAGIKTGMYTSPHLISITERVQIDGVEIDEATFAELATRVREIAEKLLALGEIENIPTYFEQVTAIALVAFADAGVELALLETGLGGRLDATTAANAEIAAVTRIDIDHQQYLGETIEEIAAEKAAIIHKGSRVVIGEQGSAAMRIVLERCRRFGIKPVLSETIPTASNLGLAGRHQRENAAIAIATAELLRNYFPISPEDIAAGLESARHPGRLERIGRFLLDGAHNIGGVRALAEYLDEYATQPITLIYGAMGDKEIGEIASLLFPRAARLVITTPDNSRAMQAEDLIPFVPEGFDRDRVFITPNATAAIEKAREISEKEDIILVTGSLYLVGEALAILTSEKTEN